MSNMIFVFLRFMYAMGSEIIGPIANAQVTLFELDDPAPPGDDVVIPPTGTTRRANREFTVTNSSSYAPNPDQSFGTLTTDENGFVEFAVSPNDVGGFLTTTSKETNNRTGKVTYEATVTDVVPEDLPDFGVTVVDGNGRTLTQRLLVALNVPGSQVGTRENPLVVKIECSGADGEKVSIQLN